MCSPARRRVARSYRRYGHDRCARSAGCELLRPLTTYRSDWAQVLRERRCEAHGLAGIDQPHRLHWRGRLGSRRLFRQQRSMSGRGCSIVAMRWEPSRLASAAETRCGSKPPCPSTAMNWPKTSIPCKPGCDLPLNSATINSSAARRSNTAATTNRLPRSRRLGSGRSATGSGGEPGSARRPCGGPRDQRQLCPDTRPTDRHGLRRTRLCSAGQRDDDRHPRTCRAGPRGQAAVLSPSLHYLEIAERFAYPPQPNARTRT